MAERWWEEKWPWWPSEPLIPLPVAVRCFHMNSVDCYCCSFSRGWMCCMMQEKRYKAKQMHLICLSKRSGAQRKLTYWRGGSNETGLFMHLLNICHNWCTLLGYSSVQQKKKEEKRFTDIYYAPCRSCLSLSRWHISLKPWRRESGTVVGHRCRAGVLISPHAAYPDLALLPHRTTTQILGNFIHLKRYRCFTKR